MKRGTISIVDYIVSLFTLMLFSVDAIIRSVQVSSLNSNVWLSVGGTIGAMTIFNMQCVAMICRSCSPENPQTLVYVRGAVAVLTWNGSSRFVHRPGPIAALQIFNLAYLTISYYH